MTPARLHTIEQVFVAALDQQPDQIDSFLDEVCEGDDLLRREVAALLDSDRRADGFIENSAVGLATRIIQNGHDQSLIGQTFGHYRIIELIGSGGMGEVYLATDIVAGRKAALKLLPLRFTGNAERLERFQREAHAVVGLNHPNILTVYEIGEDHSTHYIATELIEGETLRERLRRGRLQLDEAVDIAIQVASALAVAHRAGIVHRDIKPENIMLRTDGYVKVLDFGIAKLAESAIGEATPNLPDSMRVAETSLGSILGTVLYMSPEQACPDAAGIDHRTDIWSLGAVFYEMLTGHAPFTGDPPSQGYGAAGTPADVVAAIRQKDPLPITNYLACAPAPLQRIISKMLRKNREERCQNADELLRALKDFRRELEAKSERAPAPLWLRWAQSPTSLILALTVVASVLAWYWHWNAATKLPVDKSIAVLPLANLTDEKENAFFADGVHDQLLSDLSKIKDLKVISRASVMHYKADSARDMKEIARQLGVRNLVKGSVRRSGNDVRVSVELIDGRTDRQLWGQVYDRTLEDSLRLQGELATEISAAVGATLSPEEKARVQATPTNNPAAYDAYLRARAFPVAWAYYLHSNLEDAIRLYRQAVNLDPNFTLAWAYLSIAHSMNYLVGIDPSSLRLRKSKDALERALALDPNLPEVHLALGYVRQCDGDNTGSLAEFRQAEQGLPNSTDVIEAIAMAEKALGNWDESIAELRRAIELDPRNATAANNLALTYGDLRRFPQALATLDRVLAWDPTNGRALLTKAQIFLVTGHLQAAGPLLAKPNVPLTWRASYSLLRGRYSEAAHLLTKDVGIESDQEDVEVIRSLGEAQQLAGDVSAARATYHKALAHLQRQLKTVAPDCFEQASRYALLAEIHADLGERAAAVAEAQKAVAICPITKDALDGPVFEVNMAEIYAKLGDADHAIPILQRVLKLPCGFSVTPAVLRLDPIWNPIRNDPRFQQLLAANLQ